ncbi:hypothetical protein LWI28_026063 [Acer negundo]|uniref:Non-haem dioxygenase N-terminal domain-containing protein n=1 Tax=Acer negundo TaxID=4023 RepID=A0AAD5JG61_ACENE|nr:hypothetical protein LWI28_026063 [Acer negundo]
MEVEERLSEESAHSEEEGCEEENEELEVSNMSTSKSPPPKLELKQLPTTLKYAYLGEDETYPVIVASELECDKEEKLLELINHGVSSSLVEKVKLETEKFFKLPIEEKSKYGQPEGDVFHVEGYGNVFVGSEDTKLHWRDSLYFTISPPHLRKPHLFLNLPPSFRSEDFTLVDDDMHLKKVKTEEVFDTLLLSNFQAYQATLHLHGRYKAINDKSVALRKAGDALKAENAKLSTEKSLIEQQKVALEEELRNERARHQAEVAKLKEAAGQQDQTIEALRERALSIAVEAVCKTRAELFKEYLSGDHSKWNPQTMQEEIDIYEEM